MGRLPTTRSCDKRAGASACFVRHEFSSNALCIKRMQDAGMVKEIAAVRVSIGDPGMDPGCRDHGRGSLQVRVCNRYLV